jgi:nucleoside 2-deoxyribosyltransferase
VKLFLAYPMSSTGELDRIDAFVKDLTRALVGAGLDVAPQESGATRISANGSSSTPWQIADANIRSVLAADALVVLSYSTRAPSSIWIEMGIAFAADIPVVLVCEDAAGLPFLAHAASGGPPEERRCSVLRFPLEDPSQTATDLAASVVVLLVGAEGIAPSINAL